MSIDDALVEARRALRALRLEVPADVADDVEQRVEAVLTAVADVTRAPAVDRDALAKPRHGQLAYYEDCVEGGYPYTVVVIWRHRDPNGQGWYNVAGTEYPLNPDYLAGKALRPLWHVDDLPRLALTDAATVAAQARAKAGEDIAAAIERLLSGLRNPPGTYAEARADAARIARDLTREASDE